jgi:ABC-type multidrug transport system fused ATPase/permease subunit
MLIFDEATSALDKTNEAEVQKAIDSMKVAMGG